MSAIEDFQRSALGQATPDGRIDPHGNTFAAQSADKFSLLPHCVEPPGGGAVVSVSATSMNPGFMTTMGVTRDPGGYLSLGSMTADFIDLKRRRRDNQLFATHPLEGQERCSV